MKRFSPVQFGTFLFILVLCRDVFADEKENKDPSKGGNEENETTAPQERSYLLNPGLAPYGLYSYLAYKNKAQKYGGGFSHGFSSKGHHPGGGISHHSPYGPPHGGHKFFEHGKPHPSALNGKHPHGEKKGPLLYTKKKINSHLDKLHKLGNRRLQVQVDYSNTPLEFSYLQQYHNLPHPLTGTRYAGREVYGGLQYGDNHGGGRYAQAKVPYSPTYPPTYPQGGKSYGGGQGGKTGSYPAQNPYGQPQYQNAPVADGYSQGGVGGAYGQPQVAGYGQPQPGHSSGYGQATTNQYAPAPQPGGAAYGSNAQYGGEGLSEANYGQAQYGAATYGANAPQHNQGQVYEQTGQFNAAGQSAAENTYGATSAPAQSGGTYRGPEQQYAQQPVAYAQTQILPHVNQAPSPPMPSYAPDNSYQTSPPLATCPQHCLQQPTEYPSMSYAPNVAHPAPTNAYAAPNVAPPAPTNAYAAPTVAPPAPTNAYAAPNVASHIRHQPPTGHPSQMYDDSSFQYIQSHNQSPYKPIQNFATSNTFQHIHPSAASHGSPSYGGNEGFTFAQEQPSGGSLYNSGSNDHLDFSTGGNQDEESAGYLVGNPQTQAYSAVNAPSYDTSDNSKTVTYVEEDKYKSGGSGDYNAGVSKRAPTLIDTFYTPL